MSSKRSPTRRLLVTIASSLLLTVTLTTPAMAKSSPAPDPGIDLKAYRGKVVYLDFWASWCGPCQLSFPFMQDLEYRYGNKDLVVVAVNLDHDKARALAFLSKFHPNFSIAYDTGGSSARTFHVTDMPTSIVIDRDGKIRYVHRGFTVADEQTYFSHVSELINEHH